MEYTYSQAYFAMGTGNRDQTSLTRCSLSANRIASTSDANNSSTSILCLIRLTPSLKITTSRPKCFPTSIKLPLCISTANKLFTARASAGPRWRVAADESDSLKPYSLRTARNIEAYPLLLSGHMRPMESNFYLEPPQWAWYMERNATY